MKINYKLPRRKYCISSMGEVIINLNNNKYANK
uniref:Uncharacterized protein n=1 Tax=Geladintestivirus 1 TaxID=3233133 RepID=A0AAU8MHR2_9CAUD